MKIRVDQIKALIEQLDSIVQAIQQAEKEQKESLKDIYPSYQKSARNLIHYRSFRQFDLRSIQNKLRNLGLTRLAKAESHVKASLFNTQYILQTLIGKAPKGRKKSGLSIKKGQNQLIKHTKALLGYRSKGRRVRIMVTQPTQSAYDYSLVHQMVKNGMNCARINCAHDGPEVWKKMIAHVKKASKAMGRKVKITMDLAGPKIRTGAIAPGPKVRKFRPTKDQFGRVTKPALIHLVDQIHEEQNQGNELPIGPEAMAQLGIGNRLQLRDSRNKKRKLEIIDKTDHSLIAHCHKTCYFHTGIQLKVHKTELHFSVGELPPLEQALLLKNGDHLMVHKADLLGQPAQYHADGQLAHPAKISCQLKAVFDRVKIGEQILFDDGKIEGQIINTHPDYFEVEIKRAGESGTKLKAEKGINFPTTDLGISGLTDKDRKDLEFVVAHADVINFSFVNSRKDVEELFDQLKQLNAFGKISIILKIETQMAFDNLPDILLAAMRTEHIGVMIARGDLAVETGWNNIGRIQQEILSLCAAAHIPVVWATQVLENLAKSGLPSRSEITDAATSLRAECVMLNKGPYIQDAIQLLDTILSDMERYQFKKEAMLPRMEKLLV